MSGFINEFVHVNRLDPRDPNEPFCGCHDDPWALCPKWRDWGITEDEHINAEVLALRGLPPYESGGEHV